MWLPKIRFQKLIGYVTSEDNGFLETKNRLDRHCQNHFLCDDAIARIGECECLNLTAAANMDGSMWNTKILMSSSGRPSEFKPQTEQEMLVMHANAVAMLADGWF